MLHRPAPGIIRRAAMWAALLGVVLCSTLSAPPVAQAELAVNSGKLTYCGNPIRLVGYGIYGALTEASFPFKKYLNQLSSKGINYVRVWGNFHWTHSLTPFAGGWKNWNLTAPNEAYYSRLRNFVAHAHSKGVIVQLCLFDSVQLEKDAPQGQGTNLFKNRWVNCPYNSANNQNGYCTSAGQFEASGSPPIWKQSHKQYIERVVQAVEGYDNVIFEIFNEPYNGYGSKGFQEKVIDFLHGLVNAPGYAGSRLISTNDFNYSMQNNPKVDIISYHVGPDNLSQYKNSSKPVIVSNDGDKTQNGCIVVSNCLSSGDRINRIKKYAQNTFSNAPTGKMHLEILDKDIYGSTWGSQDYTPNTANISDSILSALAGYMATPPVACGETPEPGGGTPNPNCPVGEKIVIDNGKAGFSTTGNDWKLRDGVGQTVGATYLYLSKEVGDPNTKKGTAKWKPTIPVAGIWNVQVTFRATMNRTSDADYFVYPDQGATKKKVIDQRQGVTTEEGGFGPVYVSMGDFYFEPGGSGYAFLDGTDDNQSDCADAAVFTLVSCTDDGGGDPGGPVEPPEEPCPAGGPGPQTRTFFATAAAETSGWNYVNRAVGPPDKKFADCPNLDPGEILSASFTTCDPPGDEFITQVVVGVRNKVQHENGPKATVLALGVPGSNTAQFSHEALGWDELDVTSLKAQWSWADLDQLVAQLSLAAHPGGQSSGDVFVDAFRLAVTYQPCTPGVTNACENGQIVAIDACGAPTQVVDNCDDGDACTYDGCNPVGVKCTHVKANTLECMDPVPPPTCLSEGDLTCFGGSLFEFDTCYNLAAVVDACDDGDPCSLDTCDPFTLSCVYEPLPGPLCEQCVPNTAKACVGGDLFWVDSCGNTGAKAFDCDDKNACTVDSCDAATLSCTHSPSNAVSCQGCQPNFALACVGDALYWIDSCGNVNGYAQGCDDGDACTIDLCSPQAQNCVHQPSASPACAPCEPEHALTCHGHALYWVDSCGDLSQVANTCDDGDPCTWDTCDPAVVDCTHEPMAVAGCELCVAGAELACDDDSVVSLDSCGYVDGIVQVCTDFDACTTDSCQDGACSFVPTQEPTCANCAATQQPACLGASLVTIDGCGNLVATTAVCSDGDPCTADSCDPASLQCTFTPEAGGECAPCPAQAATACMSGDLVWIDGCGAPGGIAVDCDDSDPCTADSCNPVTKSCLHVPAGEAPGCEDGYVPCPDEPSVQCADGHLAWFDGCGNIVGIQDVCHDGDPCTTDSCNDTDSTCVFTPKASDGCGGTAVPGECDAIVGTMCVGGGDHDEVHWVNDCGQDAGLAAICTDGDPCTFDACDAELGGCSFSPNNAAGCGGGEDTGSDPDAATGDTTSGDTTGADAESDQSGPGDDSQGADSQSGPDSQQKDGAPSIDGAVGGKADIQLPFADSSTDTKDSSSGGSGSAGGTDGGCRTAASPTPFLPAALFACAWGLAWLRRRRYLRHADPGRMCTELPTKLSPKLSGALPTTDLNSSRGTDR